MLVRACDSKQSIFLWLPFFCCFRQKKVTRRFSGGSFGFDLDLAQDRRRENVITMSRLAPLLPWRKHTASMNPNGLVGSTSPLVATHVAPTGMTRGKAEHQHRTHPSHPS